MSTSNAHNNSGSVNNSRSGDQVKSFKNHLARQGKLDNKHQNNLSGSIVM